MGSRNPVWLGVLSLPLGASILAGCAQDDVAQGQSSPVMLSPAPATQVADTPEWLMVMEATGGTYDGKAATLTLTGTDPAVLAFTDRPVRQATRLSTAQFLVSWDQTFAGDPPNAAVAVSGAATDQDMIAVELGRPSYTKDGTVTFPVTQLDPEEGVKAASAVAGRTLDASLPPNFADAAVFIDYTSQLCLNLSQCPDGQQVGAAWGKAASPKNSPGHGKGKNERSSHSPEASK